MSSEVDVARLTVLAGSRPWTAALSALVEAVPGPAVFTTSFSLEDQAIVHAIVSARLPVRVAALDTGRLFEETHRVHDETRRRYGVAIEVFFPDAEVLRALISRQGPNGFFDSVEHRLACCHVRKVEPLRRALAGAALWITGIRAEHSESRAALAPVEWDAENGIAKFHPLLAVTTDDLHRYLEQHQVPTSSLHKKGFASIGCAPCTRAIAPGEPMRAGRWWWEQGSKQECGLHVHEGRLIRKKDALS